jgi:hypothetical protein
MTEAQLIAGRWVRPTVDSTVNGIARMHVSVSVGRPGDLADVPIEVTMSAGGQELAVREAPSPADYYYLETLAVTAAALFAFDNPTGVEPDSVTITMQGESATFAVTVRPPEDNPGPLVA